MIMFPWVFPIQNDRNNNSILRRYMRDVPDPPEDIFSGRFGCRRMVDKPKRVGDLAVTKEDGEWFVGFSDLVRLIQCRLPMPRLVTHRQRASKDALVRRKPAKAGVMDEGKHFRADRSFRRPEAYGGTTECYSMELYGLPQLSVRIPGSSKARRQREVRSCASGDIRVDDKRKNGMEKRRRGQLDLAAIQQMSIARNDVLHREALDLQDFVFVVFSEATIFLA